MPVEIQDQPPALSAVHAFGLGFIPCREERRDLVLRRRAIASWSAAPAGRARRTSFQRNLECQEIDEVRHKEAPVA